MELVDKHKVWRCPKYFLAFGFGTGLFPKAPGTFGTLAGILVYWLIAPLNLALYALVTILFSLLGIWICDEVSKDLGVHDHPGIVWDEVCGYLITMFAMPQNLSAILIAFIFFRLFDILKPWPIKWVDSKVSGGLGIMLDDIFAAIPAWLCTYISLRLFF